jgi:hypothetical protein
MPKFKMQPIIPVRRQLLRLIPSIWNDYNPLIRIVSEDGTAIRSGVIALFEDANVSRSHRGRGKWRKIIFAPRMVRSQIWNWEGCYDQLIVPE